MDSRIVLDLETKKTFDEVGGRGCVDQLGISVVGVYLYQTNEYQIFEEKDFGQLQNILINSELIIGFNQISFDMPVLQPYLSVDVKQLPLFDLLVDIQGHLGHRVSLDSLAKATLGVGKTGSGLDAIRFYREGRMDELKRYCQNDVKVTKDVYEYGIKHKKIYYLPKIGHDRLELKVDWKKSSTSNHIVEDNRAPAQYKLF